MAAQLLLVIILSICAHVLESTATTKNNRLLVEGSNAFGYNLLSKLYKDKSSNEWISPICITSCFTLVYPGSGGKTKSQIAKVMGYPNDGDVTKQFFQLQSTIQETYNGKAVSKWQETSTITIANKIYVAKSLKLEESYANALNDGKQSFIESIEFGASNTVKTINQWVSDNTDKKITSIVTAIDPSTQLIALNAIILKGTWKHQFDESQTSPTPFYSDVLRKNEVSVCNLMHQTKKFGYYQDGNHQFLQFHFSDSANLYALFALPIKDKMDKNGMITDKEVINTAVSKLEMTLVDLFLPKLSIEASYDLNQPLMDLGIVDAFGSNADFGKISSERLKISRVVHVTMVEMDENGLVAAAVTAIMMDKAMAMETAEPTTFRADHSFQLFIIDESKTNGPTILFMGQINNPGTKREGELPPERESTEEKTSSEAVKKEEGTEGSSGQAQAEKHPKESSSSSEDIRQNRQHERSKANVFSTIAVAMICIVASMALVYKCT